jgi:hypothetical protein
VRTAIIFSGLPLSFASVRFHIYLYTTLHRRKKHAFEGLCSERIHPNFVPVGHCTWLVHPVAPHLFATLLLTSFFSLLQNCLFCIAHTAHEERRPAPRLGPPPFFRYNFCTYDTILHSLTPRLHPFLTPLQARHVRRALTESESDRIGFDQAVAGLVATTRSSSMTAELPSER